MAVKLLGPAATARDEAAGLGDVFQWMPLPQVGWYHLPYQMMGGGAATALAAGNSGQITFMPLVVPRRGMSYDQLAVGTTVAQSGGTTTATCAAYPSTTDRSGPLISGGPLVSGNVTLTATAGNLAASVSWSPDPGLYWLAFFYRETVAPSTRASINMVQNSAPAWSSVAAATVIGSAPARFFLLTGQTGLSTSQPSPWLGGSGTVAPVVAARRSA